MHMPVLGNTWDLGLDFGPGDQHRFRRRHSQPLIETSRGIRDRWSAKLLRATRQHQGGRGLGPNLVYLPKQGGQDPFHWNVKTFSVPVRRIVFRCLCSA